MWADNETGEDLFGFRVHADLIRELIMDPTVLPATIGVYGDWGGGKSSIIKMLTEDFETLANGTDANTENYQGVAVLYFNGWLFEGYDDAKAALLSAIITSLRDHKRFGPKIKDQAGKLLKRVNWMRGARMLLTGAVAGGAAVATGGLGLAAALPAIAAGAAAGAKDSAADAGSAAVEDAGTATAEEVVADVRTFRDDFQEMIAISDIKTLVVFIDDLDRCSPERIIENLEAIKLFLNVPQTAFVIGADRRIIRQAVAWRYRDALKEAAPPDQGQFEPSERLVDDYLEKLIQIPYRLPRLSPSEIETYLTLLFCKRHLSSETFGKVYAAALDLRNTDRYRAFNQSCALEVLSGKAVPQGTSVPDALNEGLRVVASISSQITDVLQGNPRQVKRFLNAFFLRRRLADVAKLTDVKDEVLVKLMLLEYKDPRQFEKLFGGMNNDSGIIPLLTSLEPCTEKPRESEASTQEHPEWQALAKWLAMEPRLAEVDLRDYLWVTRDRLGSTMSGTRMVPLAVRAVLKQTLSAVADVAGRKAIHSLQPTERAILAEELGTYFLKKPGETKAFQALWEIATIDGSMVEPLVGIFKKVALKDLSPAIGTHIKNALKQGGHIAQISSRFMGEFSAGDSGFAKALKQK